jgi:hypothetical protein
MKLKARSKKLFQFGLLIFLAAVTSCLQANYEEPLLDYIQPPASDIVSGTFTVAKGSDMLIVTLSRGIFQERLSADQFLLRNVDKVYGENIGEPLNIPVRDSDNVVLFSGVFDAADYRLVVKKEALKTAAGRVSVQAVTGGVWESALDMEGTFGTSPIWNIAYGNGRFVAVADDGKMAHSPDARTWTAIRPGYGTMQSKFVNAIRGIAYGNNGFVAVGYATRMGWSDNGLSWIAWDESIVEGNSILAVTYGGGRFVAGGDNGKMLFLPDGGNWTGVQGDTKFGSLSIYTLAYGNGVYVAAGQNGQLAYSSDAVNWEFATNPFIENNRQHI